MSIKADSVTRIRPAWTTERGASFPDWTNATSTTIAECRFQPLTADEATEYGRQGIVRKGTLYAPSGSFHEHDRVTVGSVTYEVDGHVREWDSPTGTLAHQEVPLKAVTG